MNSEYSWDSSRDKFDSDATAANLRQPPPQVEQRVVEPTAATSSGENQPKWISWYFGAPGTLAGTVLGLALVEGIRAIPAVQTFNATHPYILGDYVHKFGLLYFRALLCVTLPLAFLNVALSIADMVTSKRMFKVRWKLIGLTVLTTSLAIAQAMLWNYLLASKFDGPEYIYDGVAGSSQPLFVFQCPQNDTQGRPTVLMTDNRTQELRCLPTWEGKSTSNGSYTDPRELMLNETRKWFDRRKTARDLVYFPSNTVEIINLINQLAPDNLVDIFATNNVVGLVVLAVFVGCAAGFSSKSQMAREGAQIVQVMRELHAILKTMMTFVISVTPVAIIPLFSGPVLAGVQTAQADLPRLCFFILAMAGASLVHMLLVLPLVLAIFTGRNPYKYLSLVRDSLFYAFSCSSSSKSLPLAIRLMDGTASDRTLSRFAASIGTGINKNGAAIYIVLALVWTFRNAGLYAELTLLKQMLICASALVASTAVAPVRTGGIAVVLSIFSFLTRLEIPYSLSFMLIAECIVDPLSTVVNLWGNLVVSRIISHKR